MGVGCRVIPFDLDTYRTSGQLETGLYPGKTTHEDDQGRFYRLGKCRVAIAKGDAVVRYFSGTTHFVTNLIASSTANAFGGIAQVSCPIGSIGWFQFKGRGRVAAKATGVIALGTKLTMTENAKLGAATVTGTQHNAVGFGYKTDASALLAADEYELQG